MSGAEKEARLYRALSLFVGAVYLLWWVAVNALLPNAFNPFGSRALVVGFIWGSIPASYLSALARRHLRSLWICSLWLITIHYYYLVYGNGGGIDWIVGAFVTVSAVSLGLLSRASLVAYSVLTAVLSLGLVILLPSLRHSVFLPGIVTVLLQANIGLQSRLGVIRDLAASNAHFQLLFNSTFEGIVIHTEGRIVQVNDALLEMLGFSTEDLIGRPVLDLIRPDARSVFSGKLTDGAIDAYQTEGLRKDGTFVDIEVRGKPFIGGERASQLITLQDISERKRQAKALIQSSEALERSNIDLQRFAYVASHDLQTPLRGIGSFVGLIQSTYGEQLDAQGRDWLQRTSQSVKQLQTLIQDLLEYSRVDARSRPFAEVSLRDVLDRATTLLKTVVQESNATITSSDLPSVKGDHTQLIQLFLNLVGNAIKYRGDETPVIHLSAEEKENEWLFALRDNGIGIAQQHHQRVFEIFKRLHDASEYPGTGIGLAVCRRVVYHHGGRIWVESESGMGSVFYFTLAKEHNA